MDSYTVESVEGIYDYFILAKGKNMAVSYYLGCKVLSRD